MISSLYDSFYKVCISLAPICLLILVSGFRQDRLHSMNAPPPKVRGGGGGDLKFGNFEF